MALDLTTRLREAVTENLNLKVLSLAFSLVLYALVHGSQEVDRVVLVNVVSQRPPENGPRVLMTEPPAQIHVRLLGPRALVDDVNSQNVGSVQLDLRSGSESHIAIEPHMIRVPAGVKIVQIDPPAIDLAWEDRVVRDVPVRVNVRGTPAHGFAIKGDPMPEPAIARVRGPRSEVAVLQFVKVDAFDLTGLAEGKYSRELAIERPAAAKLMYEQPSVTTTVEIVRELSERTFTKVQVAVIGNPKATAQPSEIDVRVTCPSEVALGLRPEQVVPRAHASPLPTSILKGPLEHGSEAVPVQVTLEQCEIHPTPTTVVLRW